MSRALPMYLALTSYPLASLPPQRYVRTAHGESFQLGGRCLSSALESSASSSENCSSACWRRTLGLLTGRSPERGLGEAEGFRKSRRAGAPRRPRRREAREAREPRQDTRAESRARRPAG